MSRTFVFFQSLAFAFALLFSSTSAIHFPDSIQTDRSQLAPSRFMGDHKTQAYRYKHNRKRPKQESTTLLKKLCDQWGKYGGPDDSDASGYMIFNNLWGMNYGQGGQCTYLWKIDRKGVGWSSEWTWYGGPYNVKSYANVQKIFKPMYIGQVGTIETQWTWSYETPRGDAVANVAYDMMTAPYSNGRKYEIMVWLAQIGQAGPISTYGEEPEKVFIHDVQYYLYYGRPQGLNTYSFVPVENTWIRNFKGDLAGFLFHLVSAGKLPTDALLETIGAGSEPFVGTDAKFTTESIHIDVEPKHSWA